MAEPSRASSTRIRPGARRAIADAATVLAGVPPFSELPPVDRAKLAASLEEVTYEQGEVIFAEGARADALYILREGLIERLADGVRLAVLDPPAVFGDLALLRDEVRSTTLVAATPCVVWRLPAERFTRLLRRTPGIGARFAEAVSHRLASSQRAMAGLAQDFEALAERLFEGLTPAQQSTLETAALLPTLEPTALAAVFGEGATAAGLPLAHLLLGEAGAHGEAADPPALPPAFRVFLLRRLEERGGAVGTANERRRVAAALHDASATDLAMQVLADGGLVAEAAALAGRPPEDIRLIAVAGERGPALMQEADAGVVLTSGRRHWRRPSRVAVGVVLAALILLAGWMAPPPPGLSQAGWHALASLLAAVPLLALEALPEGIVGLGIAVAWVLGGVAPPRTALGGFATPSWVLVVAVLGIGSAIASSGLLYRLALWAIERSRGGFTGRVLALAVAGVLISPSVPNATGRVTLIAPATAELVEAVGYAPGSRAAAGLALAVFVGFGQMVGAFLTSSSTSVLVYAVLSEPARASLSWATWALRAAPTTLLLLAGLLLFILWWYRPRPGEPGAADGPAMVRPEGLALQRALLGPISRHERTALAVALGLMVGFVSQPLHGVDPAWLGVMALGLLAATGTLSAEGLRAVNWSFALLFGILTSMADVFGTVGLDRWLAELAAVMLGGLTATPVLFVAALTLLCFALSLVLRWQAVAPLLTIALSPMAAGAGMDPWVVGMVALIACNGFFLPYQSTIYLAFFHGSGGRLFSHRQARPLALAYGVVTLLALALSVPVWRLMGLL